MLVELMGHAMNGVDKVGVSDLFRSHDAWGGTGGQEVVSTSGRTTHGARDRHALPGGRCPPSSPARAVRISPAAQRQLRALRASAVRAGAHASGALAQSAYAQSAFPSASPRARNSTAHLPSVRRIGGLLLELEVKEVDVRDGEMRLPGAQRLAALHLVLEIWKSKGECCQALIARVYTFVR